MFCGNETVVCAQRRINNKYLQNILENDVYMFKSEVIKVTEKKKLLIDAETVIVNLLKEDMKSYLKLSRLDSLVKYIRVQLVEMNLMEKYQEICFDVSFDAIERTVYYNNTVFDLIGDEIILRGSLPIELDRKYQPSDDLRVMIKSFVRENAA